MGSDKNSELGRGGNYFVFKTDPEGTKHFVGKGSFESGHDDENAPPAIDPATGEEAVLTKSPPEMAGVTVADLEASEKRGLPTTFINKSASDD